MLAGEKTLGTFIIISSGTSAECIGLAGTIEDAKTDFAMGFDSVTYNQDAPLLIEMLKEAKSAILGA